MRRIFPIPAVFLLLLVAASFRSANAQVLPGVDVLVENDFREVAGKRVGLVVNQTSIRRDPRQTTVDAFLATDRCVLTALFAPEHGIDGSVLAGEDVANRTYNGIPVHSLYGPTKKPTPSMLKNVDVMVYDIQDIGVRSYTFISTLVKVMEGCAEAGVPVVVLDRPNPIGGDVVDGPVLDTAFRSFVGIVPVPYVYGLTAGELALMANEEGWLAGGVRCKLTVVRVEGWERTMTWRETGLPWIPPSPHVPTPEAGFANAVTGAIGELGVVSVGIGYTLPFELIGATWIDGADLAARLNGMRVPGLFFRKTAYKPFYGWGKDQVCGGVQVMRTGETPAPFAGTVALLTVLRDAYPARNLIPPDTSSKWNMFDKVCGGDGLRRALAAGRSYEQIVEGWNDGLRRYLSRREEYLLYE